LQEIEERFGMAILLITHARGKWESQIGK